MDVNVIVGGCKKYSKSKCPMDLSALCESIKYKRVTQVSNFSSFWQNIECLGICIRSMPVRYGMEKKEIILIIKNFQATDLLRDFNCSAKNEKGLISRRAELTVEGNWKDSVCVKICFFSYLSFVLWLCPGFGSSAAMVGAVLRCWSHTATYAAALFNVSLLLVGATSVLPLQVWQRWAAVR